MKFENRSDKIKFYVWFILLLLDTLAWIPALLYELRWELNSPFIQTILIYLPEDVPFFDAYRMTRSFMGIIVNIPIAIILSIANIKQLQRLEKSDNKKSTKNFISIVVAFLIITDLVIGRIVELQSFAHI